MAKQEEGFEISGPLEAAMVLFAAASSDLGGGDEELAKARVEFERLAEPYKDRLKSASEFIKAHLLEIEHTVSHESVKATFRKGHERVSWNGKELDSLCLKNPALLEMLGSARKISPVKPSISVKWDPTWVADVGKNGTGDDDPPF
jgi:hypothetical protein